MFALALIVTEILTKFLTLKNMSRSWNTIVVMTTFDGKYQNLQKDLYKIYKTRTHFLASSHRFKDSKIFFFLTLKK